MCQNVKGASTAIFVQEGFQREYLKLENVYLDFHFEGVSARVLKNGMKFCISAIYRLQEKGDYKIFYEWLEMLLSKIIVNKIDTHVVCGDFNIDFSKDSGNIKKNNKAMVCQEYK